MRFQTANGDWTEFRKQPEIVEVDFHFSEAESREVPYWEAMEGVYEVALEALQDAYRNGRRYGPTPNSWTQS